MGYSGMHKQQYVMCGMAMWYTLNLWQVGRMRGVWYISAESELRNDRLEWLLGKRGKPSHRNHLTPYHCILNLGVICS